MVWDNATIPRRVDSTKTLYICISFSNKFAWKTEVMCTFELGIFVLYGFGVNMSSDYNCFSTSSLEFYHHKNMSYSSHNYERMETFGPWFVLFNFGLKTNFQEKQ
jgi:hypothetical protein